MPLIALIITITLASAQPAAESGALSGRFARGILRVVTPGFDRLSRSRQNVLARNFNNQLRKWAHGFLFMLAGMASMLALGVWMRDQIARRMIAGYAVAMLLAVADETHQLFVDGRGAQVADVLIDWGGAGLGMMLSGAVGTLLYRRRKRRA